MIWKKIEQSFLKCLNFKSKVFEKNNIFIYNNKV